MSLISRKQKSHYQSRSKLGQQGFTLIELIVGIIVLTISLAIVSTLIAPAEEKSADNVLQIKASELGQSLMNDITSRAFDDNSDNPFEVDISSSAGNNRDIVFDLIINAGNNSPKRTRIVNNSKPITIINKTFS